MATGSPSESSTRGLLAALSCYVIWGLVPLYWKQMANVDAVELIAHRMVWSLVFLVVLMVWLHTGRQAIEAYRNWRSVGLNFLSGVLLTINWVIYIWGVNAGHVIECSLGYFLVPLLNVGLGRLVLKESLRPLQWLAVGAATMGVAVLVVKVGHVPWIALGLAFSFGFYGLLRKKSPLGSLVGLTVETSLVAPFAAAWLLWLACDGRGSLGHVDLHTTAFVLSTGVVTAIPLLLFGYGALRLRLTTLGLLQYAAPTLQFLLGWLVYHEPFSKDRAEAFLLIWMGLAIYSLDAWTQQRRDRSAVAAPA